MTLEGTNTYLVGRDPTVVIDPGPDDPAHIEAIRKRRRGAGRDRDRPAHTRSRRPHRLASRRSAIEPARPADGETIAGLTAIATPGHAADHLCFLLPSGACFSGDLILGEGSTIVGPREMGGSLADYMDSLRRLQGLDLRVLYPGHGPEIDDPQAKNRRVHRAPPGAGGSPRCCARARRALAGRAARRGLGRRARAASRRRRDRDAGPPREARGRGPAALRTCATDRRSRAPGMKVRWAST